ncbi:MAG: GTP cyclohydrolase IIa [Desulfurococcales archaeon]|nr:GTP cyclohydrolase IIa [Desulfurococcales archaeon]
MKTRITLIELRGYREWTESLGYDREWRIQVTQSRVYYELQNTASRVGAYILPLRHDFIVALTSSLQGSEHEQLFETALEESPVPVRMASIVDNTPREALNNAFRTILEINDNTYYLDRLSPDEYTAVSHVDINSVTKYTLDHGVLEAYEKTMEILYDLVKLSSLYGGITQYLGGDNIIIVFPPDSWREASRKLLFEWVKVGGGRARLARKSMELATRALDEIRQGITSGINLLEE